MSEHKNDAKQMLYNTSSQIKKREKLNLKTITFKEGAEPMNVHTQKGEADSNAGLEK